MEKPINVWFICLVLVFGGLIGMAAASSVKEICAATDYKEMCEKVLGVVNSPDPKEYIKQAILSTEEEIKKAFKLSGDLVVKANTTSRPKMIMALEDCEELLQDAIQELQASFSMVGDSQIHTMDRRIEELQNWLSAVISYQETCKDQLGKKDSDLKTSMNNGLLDAGQLTSNALAIIGSMSKILSLFDLQIDLPFTKGRRLLTLDDEGYPHWLPEHSRRLMAKHRANVLKPNAVVAQDGSGQYKTIMAAINAYPAKSTEPYIIHVKAGVYKEYVTVGKKHLNVFMYGDGPDKTIITGSRCNRNGYKTMNSATVAILGDGFIGKDMGFENTAGPEGHQAVALRVQADKSAFTNCKMDGYQDTLYVQTHRQFYTGCTISGTIDFIFGDSSTVIQNSLIVVRRPMDNQQNTVTAHGRKDKHEITGLVLQNCRIVADPKLVPDIAKIPSYLGRPWKEYSRAIIMESEISDVIHPDGWLPWAGNFALDTLYFAEYGNRGPGAATDKRVKWKGMHILKNKNEVLQYTTGQFIQGQEWLKDTSTLGNVDFDLTEK